MGFLVDGNTCRRFRLEDDETKKSLQWIQTTESLENFGINRYLQKFNKDRDQGCRCGG